MAKTAEFSYPLRIATYTSQGGPLMAWWEQRGLTADVGREVVMYWLLGYCGVCWGIGALLARKVSLVNVECAAGGANDNRKMNFWLQGLIISAAPCWVPLAFVWLIVQISACLRAGWQIRRTAQQFRELMLQPCHVRELDEYVQESIDELTTEFICAGLEPQGDYFNKPAPVEVYDRYFYGFDGTVMGSITTVLDQSGAGLMSILADRTYVETAASDASLLEDPQPADLLRVEFGGDVSVAQLLQQHLAAVQEECAQRCVGVLSFPASAVTEVARYGNRRFWQWRSRCGEATGPVPPAVPPVGCERPAQSLSPTATNSMAPPLPATAMSAHAASYT